MVISYILILFCIVLLLCSMTLSFLKFSPTWLRRTLKIVFFIAVLVGCIFHIRHKYRVTPYVPTYNPPVYVTDYGANYHMRGCGYLWNSSNQLTLYEAVVDNYRPCSRCKPWEYSDAIISNITASLKSPLPKFDEFILSKQYVVSSAIVALIFYCLYQLEKNGKINVNRHPQLSKMFDYICVSYILLFLPGVLICFTLLFSLESVAVLFFVPIQSLFRKAKDRTRHKSPWLSKPVADNSCVISNSSSSNIQTDSPAYKLCKFMWTRTIIFCNELFINPSLMCNVDVWTTFFYCIAKSIRQQKIVDEIYSQFIPSAVPFITGCENIKPTEDYIQSCYWQLRTILNSSNLDPRNEYDLAKLWMLTAQRISLSSDCIQKFESSFFYNVKLLTNYALEQYHFKPFKEHYFYDIE